MPAAIFNGQFVKVLKDEIKSKSGGLFDKVFTSAKSTNFTAEVGFTYLINTGTAVTKTGITSGSAVVFDNTDPGLASITVASSNSTNSSYGIEDDIISLFG